MNKNIIKATGFAFAGLLAVGTFTSCSEDLLDIEKKGATPLEKFYKTDADAQSAMVATYDMFTQHIAGFNDGFTYCPFRFVFNLCGDDLYAAGEFFGDNDFAAELNEFRYDANSAVVKNSYYHLAYAAYYANLVINYFGGDKADTQIKKQAVAEARVLRAYIQMMLTIGWYNPPFLDHLIQGSELPYNCDQDPNKPMTHEQVLDWCAQECLEAAADLPERQSPTDKDGAVVVTKGFAYAVAGKAYLFEGESKYADAAAALEKVINSGKYKLVPGSEYANLFHIEGDCNEEKIFEANIEACGVDQWGGYIQKTTWMEANIWNWRSDHFVSNPSASYSSIDGWGGCGVPKWVADEFIQHDGTDSYRIKGTIINIDDVVYNSVYNTAADNLSYEEKKTSAEVGLKANGLYGQSFYLPLKPVARRNDLRFPGDNMRLNNFTIMRYAEVLLMYAEASLKSNPAAALNAVNQIRTRAGIAPLTSVTLADIKAEKKIELWLEGNRWADLVRWGDTEGVKKAGQNVTQLYDKVSRAPQAGDENVVWENGDASNSRFYLVSTHEAINKKNTVGFKAGKHEYFPFPADDLSQNPNLKQREGAGW